MSQLCYALCEEFPSSGSSVSQTNRFFCSLLGDSLQRRCRHKQGRLLSLILDSLEITSVFKHTVEKKVVRLNLNGLIFTKMREQGILRKYKFLLAKIMKIVLIITVHQ